MNLVKKYPISLVLELFNKAPMMIYFPTLSREREPSCRVSADCIRLQPPSTSLFGAGCVATGNEAISLLLLSLLSSSSSLSVLFDIEHMLLLASKRCV